MNNLLSRVLTFCVIFHLTPISIASAADAFFNDALLRKGRNQHTATLLADGRVLIAGGNEALTNAPFSSVEIYDPVTRTTQTTGSLATPRAGHLAVLLPNKKVLVAGITSTAEVYNPATGVWADATPQGDPFVADSCTLLDNGNVLVIGGTDPNSHTSMAKLYHPQTNSWTSTASLTSAYRTSSATLLKDGRVLVAGGSDNETNSATTASEIYNPASGTWSPSNPLLTPRKSPVTRLLPNGEVLALGGDAADIPTAEVFNPADGSWTVTGSLTKPRFGFATVSLKNGSVLVTGGFQDTNSTPILSSSEIYDPASGIWKRVDSMNTLRCLHQATALPDGSVLITGGWGYRNPSAQGDFDHGIRRSERYKAVAGKWSEIAPMSNRRQGHTATRLANGNILVTGGSGDIPIEIHGHLTGPISSAEVLNPTKGIWSNAGSMNSMAGENIAIPMTNGNLIALHPFGGTSSIYQSQTASWLTARPVPSFSTKIAGVLLPNGKILATGNSNGSSQLYDPKTELWIATSKGGPKTNHTATLLSNGKVLTVENNFENNHCHIYDPATDKWTATASPAGPRYQHSTCLLPSGKVIICGGLGYDNLPLTSVEIYDPATGRWSAAQPTNKARRFPSLVNLGSNKILITGGTDPETSNTAEIYDETAGTWTPTAPMLKARTDFAVTSLPGGKILVTGGVDASILSSVEIFELPAPEIVVEYPKRIALTDGIAKVNFKSVKIGKKGIAKIFTIRNTGTANLSGLSISKGKAGKKNYTVGPLGKTTLAPGDSTNFRVTFKPLTKGTFDAGLFIRCNDADESPFDIDLTGKGTK